MTVEIGYKDFTTKDLRDMLLKLYRGFLENERRTDPHITRFPDVEGLLEHMDHNQTPPLLS